MESKYAVLGDLGQGRYIVRMFIREHSVDEELEASSPEALKEVIEGRLAKLEKESQSVLRRLSSGAKMPDTIDHAIGGL